MSKGKKEKVVPAKAAKKKTKEANPAVQEGTLGRKATGPAFWVGLLLIPIVLTIIATLMNTMSPDAPEEAAEAVNAAVLTAQQQEAEQGARAERNKQGACEFDYLIGRQTGMLMQREIGQFGRPFRIIKPGDMITEDYRPLRINIELDGNGTVTRVWCG